MSITIGGSGFIHARPAFRALRFDGDDIDSVASTTPLNATDAQIGGAFEIAEQALKSLEGHGRACASPTDVVTRYRSKFIAWLSDDPTNQVPLDHHLTNTPLSDYPHAHIVQEQWRYSPS